MDTSWFEYKIDKINYPVLVMLHGKHSDDPYLAMDKDNLIDCFYDIFQNHRDTGYYDECKADFDKMSKLEIAAFVYLRSDLGCEYETVEISQFLN